MEYRYLSNIYYLSIGVGCIGLLFKLNHWPYGLLIQYLALVTSLLFYVYSFGEIIRSKKAESSVKLLWLLAYLIVLPMAILYFNSIMFFIICGGVYNHYGRKIFRYSAAKAEVEQMDIFKKQNQ